MKKIFTLITFLALSLQLTWAQTAPDFTFTDVHGETHNLQHTLDQGYIVLLDFFFVNCPPCRDSAPLIQSIHEDYADKNVVVFSVSDRDSDTFIDDYKTGAGLTYISGGNEGGGPGVLNTYANAFNFTGFPTISIICSDGSITWDIWPLTAGAQNLRDAIDACGAVDADDYVAQSTTAVQAVTGLQNAVFAPNPATITSRLQFELAVSTNLTVSLMNAQGALVQKVFNGQLTTGVHHFDINLAKLPAAAYWLRIQNTEGQTTSMPIQKL